VGDVSHRGWMHTQRFMVVEGRRRRLLHSWTPFQHRRVYRGHSNLPLDSVRYVLVCVVDAGSTNSGPGSPGLLRRLQAMLSGRGSSPRTGGGGNTPPTRVHRRTSLSTVGEEDSNSEVRPASVARYAGAQWHIQGSFVATQQRGVERPSTVAMAMVTTVYGGGGNEGRVGEEEVSARTRESEGGGDAGKGIWRCAFGTLSSTNANEDRSP
jgi:hypothetical protein